MIRFRNPASELKTQLRVLKNIHNQKSNTPISLNDMKYLATQDGMMTSHGYAGDMAIELNKDKETSRDGAFNNVKMYAEIFRQLGIFSPETSDKSYPIIFTFIGHHIATSDAPEKLVEECFWGMNTPNRLTDKMTYEEHVRFAKCTLRMIIDLGGTIYKHELCMGSMSVNDNSEEEYSAMIKKLKGLRGDKKRFKNAFEEFAASLGMKPTSVDNCTRIPIKLLKYCGYVEDVRDKTLFNKMEKCLKITTKGIDTYNRFSKMKDIRLDDFEACSENEQISLIRLGMYSMLERAGYNMEDVFDVMEEDKKVLSKILNGKELLFSPCATLPRNIIEKVPEFKNELQTDNKQNYQTENNHELIFSLENKVHEIKVDFKGKVDFSKLNEKHDKEFLERVYELNKKSNKVDTIVEILFEEHRNDKKDVFYPLISTLFKVIGFDSEVSRDGDNGSRFDVVIVDRNKSIPIEVKSPTEEDVVNVKAIRQALENKIVMLSRKKFITDNETTSMAVGYELPNNRADIQNLIYAIKETFGFRIGVIGFKSLLYIAVNFLIEEKSVDKNSIFMLEGLNDAKI